MKLQLGQSATAAATPEKAIIDVVPAPQDKRGYVCRFTCPEFTSLCPVTGQPDFAEFIIDYVPDQHLIESKALKLFLQSFRNHGAFHEDCSLMIAHRLMDAAQPHWLRLVGYWYPRGGIPIDVFWQSGEPPTGLLIPGINRLPYRGR